MKAFDFPQYSPEWWLARKGVPTASGFKSIVTPKKFEPSKSMDAYACQLVAEKFDKFYSIEPEFETQAMREGSTLEPDARAYYEFQRGHDVTEVGFCLTDDERFGCSPDGLIGEVGCLELKCPQPATHVRYLHDGGLPDDYAPQCHGHLIVTGRDWCDFMSYAPGLPPHLVRIYPDERTELLRKSLEAFWVRYQEILASVGARHREYIDSEIDRRQDTNPKPLQSFVA
jgi:hypothetical protein